MYAELSKLIQDVRQIKQAKQFPQYIKYIQFPYFRNVELNQRINFDFPFTAFIGPNGSGKSSTLHALYGCPEGKTPYDFWFDSEVDPVEYQLKGSSLRHSFFYAYDENSVELQVVKARIRRENNPNYWETSRPLLSYGMDRPPNNRERNEPINKEVVYFDFRSELSAFDKYFYFENPPSYLVNNKKQEFIRYKSRILRNLFNKQYQIASDTVGKPNNEPIIELNISEVEIISYILGKNYSNIEVIKHRLFHNWGFSIRLKTEYHQYSEAFAGSGEVAIVRLVHELENANEGALILLDEPEVSLHPAAQKRLKVFLLDQIKRKKHQIVISTHSPNLIEGLPRQAIKIFSQKIDSGKFIIKENILPEEAFYFIGQNIGDKINIIVEDQLSKKLIDKILLKQGDEVRNLFEVKFLPGGASVLQQYISVYSNANIKKFFFVFDGDQKSGEELFDPNLLSDANKTVEYLNEKIKSQTGVEIKFYPDGSSVGGNRERLIRMQTNYLRYYKEHIFYLPNSIPEDLIWSEEVIEQVLNEGDYNNNIERIRTIGNNKHRIKETSKILFGDINVGALEDILIKEWLIKEDENYAAIKRIIANMEERIS